MDQMSACFCLEPVASGLPTCHRWFAENNFAAIAFDGLGFDGRRVPGHDDPGGDSSPCRRAGDRGAMIATRLRDDSLRRLFLGGRRVSKKKTANFDRAGFLQVLALDAELGS